MTAILAIYRWAPMLKGHKVIIHTDNISTRAAINRGASRDQDVLMPHLKHLFWICNIFDIDLHCVYIPGNLNIEADAISRMHQAGHFMHWASLIHNGAPFDILLFIQLCVHHMSFSSLNHLLSQVPKLVPWFNAWTMLQPFTGLIHLQPPPNGHIQAT